MNEIVGKRHVNNKINTLKSVGLKTIFYFARNMKIIAFEPFTTATAKEEMFEYNVALNRSIR